MKDRIAEHILSQGVARGELQAPGGTVVAASSGNTGAAVAKWCTCHGVRAIIITNAKCSEEKCAAIRAYGASLLIAKAHEDYMEMERTMCDAHQDWFAFDQYNNMDNARAHELTTGTEIWDQTNGTVTHFVMTASTGGTLTGVARCLKAPIRNPSVITVLADPKGSVLAHYVQTGEVRKSTEPIHVEGAGKKNIPSVFDASVVDQVVRVEDVDAFAMCHRITRTHGWLVGGSTGVNVHAAVEVADRLAKQGDSATVVTLICDSGIKYLSKVYNRDKLFRCCIFLCSRSMGRGRLHCHKEKSL